MPAKKSISIGFSTNAVGIPAEKAQESENAIHQIELAMQNLEQAYKNQQLKEQTSKPDPSQIRKLDPSDQVYQQNNQLKNISIHKNVLLFPGNRRQSSTSRELDLF